MARSQRHLRERGTYLSPTGQDASAVPVNITPPVSFGKPIENSFMSALPGVFSGDPETFAYQWQRGETSTTDFTDVIGATNSFYRQVAADVGFYMRVGVSAANQDGVSPVAYSLAIGPVIGSLGKPDIQSIVIDDFTPEVGQLLTAIAQVDPGVDDVTYTWEWILNGELLLILPEVVSITLSDLTPETGQVLTATAEVNPGQPAASYAWEWTASDPSVILPVVTSVTLNDTSPEVGQVLTATAVLNVDQSQADLAWEWSVS